MSVHESPADAAQSLVSYLDSSGGQFHTLFQAVDILESDPDTSDDDLDVRFVRHKLEAANEHLEDAFEALEDGDDALMSERYIEWSGEFTDEPRFRAGAGEKATEIREHLEDATIAYEEALRAVVAVESIPTDELAGSYGVYDALDTFMEYVESDIEHMFRLAERIEEGTL